jgi:DNA-binding MarR family transcriptional regulator
MELAGQLGINAAAVTRQINEMEREGLVRRRADPKDGRRNYVKLSAKGLRLFEEIHDRSHELERSLSSVIGDKEMAIAASALLKLREFVATLRGDGK